MANNIVATWGFKRKLPEPFEDYTDHAIFDDIASKYCTQPRKKSTLHAATLRAVLAYLELESPVGSTSPEKLGAVGTQSNNFVVAEYPSKTGDLQVVVYNQLNGSFTEAAILLRRMWKAHRKNTNLKTPNSPVRLCCSH